MSMTNIEKKLDELLEWSGKEKRPPLPSHLLPNYSDMEALVYRDTPAMLYFSQLFSDMAEEIERLRKLVEGKPS